MFNVRKIQKKKIVFHHWCIPFHFVASNKLQPKIQQWFNVKTVIMMPFSLFLIETLGVKLKKTKPKHSHKKFQINCFFFTFVHFQLPETEENSLRTANSEQTRNKTKRKKIFSTLLFGYLPACCWLNDSQQLQKYNNHFLFVAAVDAEKWADRTLLLLSISQFSIDTQITSAFNVQVSLQIVFHNSLFFFASFNRKLKLMAQKVNKSIIKNRSQILLQ